MKSKAAILNDSLEKIVKGLNGGKLMKCGWEELDFFKTDRIASDNKEESKGNKVDDEYFHDRSWIVLVAI